MSLIQPFSDSSAFASGGKWEPIQANFPALAAFFKCDEATSSSGLGLTDSITLFRASGTSVTNTKNVDGTQTLSSSLNTLNGTIPAPATKGVIIIYVGKATNATSNIRFGITTGGTDRGFSITNIAASAAVVYGDGGVGAISSGVDAGLAGDAGWKGVGCRIEWNTANGIVETSLNSSNVWTTSTYGNTTGHTGIATMSSSSGSINFGTNSAPASIQLWYFTALPTLSEIQAAVAWTRGMIENDATAKYAYPGFAGRT